MEEATVSENPGVDTFTTSADKTEGARKLELTYNFGKDIEEATALHGAEVVHGMFVKAMKVAIQANVRRMLCAAKEDGSAEYTDDQIKAWANSEYKPGVRSAKASAENKLEKLIAQLKKLPPEMRKAKLAELLEL